MKKRRLGYARVSTKDQTLERQIKLLNEVNVNTENIYFEKISGKTLNRSSWKELLADLIMGDTLVVTELDRLGRTKKDILATFELLKAKGVYIEIINMPFLNTNTENEIMREVLQPSVLNVLSYFAEKEVKQKKERQAGAYAALPTDEKGRKLSIKKNKVVGRPNKQENLTSEQKRYIDAWIAGNIKTKDCIEATGIGKTTLFKIKKLLE
ncbi:recombinase family protein [Fusobacterium sp. SYSU M8A802]